MPMNFQRLQSRLILHLRDRIQSGQLSERRLARLTGVSQPHMHNVLKGKRLLSIAKADQILHHLRIDLSDLMKQ
jgi:transcriptional regulator with XRE-family HTH domain